MKHWLEKESNGNDGVLNLADAVWMCQALDTEIGCSVDQKRTRMPA